MRKDYVSMNIEIVRLSQSDVIRTSQDVSDPYDKTEFDSKLSVWFGF